MRSRMVWRTALLSTFSIGIAQTTLLSRLPGHHMALMIVLPFFTLLVALASSAAMSVHSLDAHAELSRN